MKKLWLGILLVLPQLSFAECVNLNFLSYEIECKNNECINPYTNPPKSLDFHLDANGQAEYSTTREIGFSKLITGLHVQKVAEGYNLTTKSVFIVRGSEFAKREQTNLVKDTTNFAKIQLYAGAITNQGTVYVSRVHVLPGVACN